MNAAATAFSSDAPVAVLTEAPLAKRTWRDRLLLPRQGHLLGLTWMHGEFHAAVFHNQAVAGVWASSTPVNTLEEFGASLDAALQALKFQATEVFLILEHERFQHLPEQAPAFSESATRAFLKAHVARLEQTQEPMLWVSQRTSSQRNEASVLLHLLSNSFYDQLNRLMLGRRLELTRIVPLVVPLQLIIDNLADAREHPVLLATPAGRLTQVVAGRAGQPLLFTRSILAPWNVEPGRLAVEFNRSLLYAKQQFSTTIDRLRLVGPLTEELQKEIRARCSTAKDLAVVRSAPVDWMLAVARLSPRHPINLVAGYLSHKQRQRMYRRILIAGCSLAFVLTALEAVSRWQNGREEVHRLQALQENEPLLLNQRGRLSSRNTDADTHGELLQELTQDRLLPVPSRFLAWISTVLPTEARLTHFSSRMGEEQPGWTFRLEGLVDGEEDLAQELLAAFERQLQRSPFQVTIHPQGKVTAPTAGPNLDEPPRLRFSLEGGLLEN